VSSTASVAARVVVGFAAFLYFAVFPFRASTLAYVALSVGISSESRAAIFEQAEALDPCNTRILENAGDMRLTGNSWVRAAINYGRAMRCSPANAAMRFKYGESLLGMGFIEGAQFVDQAIYLEPNNPVFASEYRRLKALQRQLR
jgi:predicted Zn-dependent protease